MGYIFLKHLGFDTGVAINAIARRNPTVLTYVIEIPSPPTKPGAVTTFD